VRKIHTAISRYLWREEIFKVPLSTLQRPIEQGGVGLIHVAAKSRALQLYRLRIQGQKTGTITAEWLRAWDLLKPSKTPPNRDRIPASMEYLRIHVMDSAYIAPLGPTKSVRAYKRRIYDTHPLTRNDRTSGDAHHTSLAKHGLGNRLEELKRSSSTGDNKGDLVPGHS
jgi:hypothetical protein